MRRRDARFVQMRVSIASKVWSVVSTVRGPHPVALVGYPFLHVPLSDDQFNDFPIREEGQGDLHGSHGLAHEREAGT